MLHLVLFEPEIPPNTGNIGRLCHATDSRLHLIEPLGFSLEEKALRRAGLDYWAELDYQVWPSWDAFVHAAGARCSEVQKDPNFWFLTTKCERIYWEATFQDEDYLIFGPETRGLPESLLSNYADRCLTIPQKRGRSLNLATAAGIVLYEGLRQIELC